MPWTKLGRVFVPEGGSEWMVTHAAMPRAIHLDGDHYRVFFATRDRDNQSHIAFLDLDLGSGFEITKLSDSPVLSPGESGCFDESGVLPTSLIQVGQGIGLFYVGISKSVKVPFSSFLGLSLLNETYDRASRFSQAPILDRSADDPVSIGGASVLFDSGLKEFRMWYGSTRYWGLTQGGHDEIPIFKIARSEDGTEWIRQGGISFGDSMDIEYFATPCVLREERVYRMWFSFKEKGRYRIGYATSTDGLQWNISEEGAGITVSTSGWDSESIEYPDVFRHRDRLYMLYNGNDYGKTGFGLAVMET